MPQGEFHVYTDGSAIRKNGRWRAGSGVWFSDDSPNNISAIPKGKQTNNRAELTAIILAVRKAVTLAAEYQRMVVFINNSLCIYYINKWMKIW